MKMDWSTYNRMQLECMSLAQAKNKLYGDSMFKRFGLPLINIHLFEKIERVCHMVETGDENFESLADSYKDIVNYALYGLILLEEQKYDRQKG